MDSREPSDREIEDFLVNIDRYLRKPKGDQQTGPAEYVPNPDYPGERYGYQDVPPGSKPTVRDLYANDLGDWFKSKPDSKIIREQKTEEFNVKPAIMPLNTQETRMNNQTSDPNSPNSAPRDIMPSEADRLRSMIGNTNQNVECLKGAVAEQFAGIHARFDQLVDSRSKPKQPFRFSQTRIGRFLDRHAADSIRWALVALPLVAVFLVDIFDVAPLAYLPVGLKLAYTTAFFLSFAGAFMHARFRIETNEKEEELPTEARDRELFSNVCKLVAYMMSAAFVLFCCIDVVYAIAYLV